MNEFITVFSAETMRRVKSRTFWLGLIFGIVGVAAMMLLPRYFVSYAQQSKRIILAGQPQLVAAARPLLQADFDIVGQRASAPGITVEQLHAKKASALVELVPGAHGVDAVIWTNDPGVLSSSRLERDLVPLNLQLAAHMGAAQVHDLMRVSVQTHPLASKFGSAAEADAAKTIAYILLLLLYLLIMVNSQIIMGSVAEEKTSRIAEILVASVNPNTLLAGKIASSGALAVAQMVVWVAIAYALGAQTPGGAPTADTSDVASFSLTGISAVDIAAFVAFFFLGFLQMSTLFAAFGSLINRTEDLGSVSGPLFLPVVAAFIIAVSALAVPDSPAVIVTSFVPIIAPFVMFARIIVSSVPPWEIGLSLAVNIAAVWAIAILGGKIYRVGMLLYGRSPTPLQVWNVIRS
jgi:ABC-type Na+ efflux pump permease subunit